MILVTEFILGSLNQCVIAQLTVQLDECQKVQLATPLILPHFCSYCVFLV